MRSPLYVFILLLVITLSCTSRTSTIYVSPDGDDTSNGTIDNPFKTLTYAKAYVRTLKKRGHQGINVILRGGTYILSESIVFDVGDSGTKSSPISYQAYEDERPIISSAVTLNGWKKAMNLPENFPSSTYDNVWVAEFPNGQTVPKYLYKDGQVLPRSITEGFVPYAPFTAEEGVQKNRRNVEYPSGIIKNWDNVEDMELMINPKSSSVWYNFPIRNVYLSRSTLVTSVPGAYALGNSKTESHRAKKSAWFTNCPEGLLKQGSWYVNTVENKVYLVSENLPVNISMPLLKEFIRVEGVVGKSIKQDIPVRHIHFKGITFTGGKRDTWGKRHVGHHIQHEWERYNQADAMLRFRGAEDCLVSDCDFISSGAGGVRLDLHCQNITIENGTFKHLGAYGIFLCGYGIGDKDVNKNNVIRNNQIAYVGEAYKHSAAITLFQSGYNRIVSNTITHTPYNSVVISGPREFNKASYESGLTALIDVPDTAKYDLDMRLRVLHSRHNLIENNDISHSVESLNGGNVIYLSYCGEENIIRHNYIHDITSPYASAAISTDAMTRLARFENNLFYNINQSAINVKGINHITDNIIVDANLKGKSAYLVFNEGAIDQPDVHNNVFVNTSKFDGQFIMKSITNRLSKSSVDDTNIKNNVFYQTDVSSSFNGGIFEIKKDEESSIIFPYTHTDSQFKYLDITGIAIKDSKPYVDIYAPIFKQGHKAFDLSKVGVKDQGELALPSRKILSSNFN